MTVEISDADWQVLNLTTKGGVSEDDIAYSINAYREEGKSDEEIQEIINAKIAENRPIYDGIQERLRTIDTEFKNNPERKRAEKTLARLESIKPVMNAVGAAGRYLNAMSLGLGDLGAAGVDWATGKVGIDTGLVESTKQFEKEHPYLTGGAEIAGIFTPGGALSKGIKYGAKLGQAAKAAVIGDKTSRAARAAGYLTEVGVRSAAAEGAFKMQEIAEQVAGTKDWEEGQTILSTVGDAGQGTLANMGIDMIFGGIGGAVRKIKQSFAVTDGAIALLGGKENVIKGQEAYKAAKAAGVNDTSAAGAFFEKVAENIEPEQSEQIAKMLQKSPRFRNIAIEQMTAGKSFIYNTAEGLTNVEKGKAAKNINDFLGKAYTDAIGARQLGTTADDLVKYTGVNSPNFQEIKSAGLKEAQENIALHNWDFSESVRFAGDALRTDKAATDVIINNAQVANFSALKPGGHAEKAMAAYVDKAKNEYINSQMQQMKNVAPEETQDIIAQLSAQFEDEMADGVKEQFAHMFAKNIIRNGTDNVYDLMDMQAYVGQIKKSEVVKGLSNAVGTYHKKINNLMGAESKILDGSLKAMTNSDDLLAFHKMGESFSPTSLTSLKNKLAESMDAKEAATKLASFKLGFENRFLNAMIKGDYVEFSELKAMTEKPGVLSEFFEAGELQEFAKQSAPKVIAANNLRTWLSASGKYESNTALIDPLIRMFIAGAAGARVAGANAAVTTARKISFGPRTMAMVEEFATNPSAESFNKMLRSAKDTTERNLMMRVVDSLGDGINQYLIMTGKTLSEGD